MPFLKGIGPTEIIIVALVLFVLFGGKKLTEWAKGVGEAGKELKKAKKEFETAFDDKSEPATETKPAPLPQPEEKPEEQKDKEEGKEVA